jgi:hypothetical protein
MRGALRTLLGIGALLVTSGCPSSDARVDERRYPEDYTFRWQVPTRVRVSEENHLPSGPVILEYQAELVRDGDGEQLRFRHLDGEVKQVGELVVDYDDRLGDQVKTAHALGDLSDMIIARDGRVIGCVGSPRLRRRASSYLVTLDKVRRVAYEVQIRDAAEAAVERATCVERWQSWVSAWSGFEALPGLPDHWHADRDVPVGEEPKIKVVDEHVGWLKQGGVRITRRQVAAGAALGAELVPLAKALSDERKTPIVADRLTIQAATWLATADIDPRTLKPKKVEWTKTLRYALDGMADQRVTRRVWRFVYE